MPTLTLDQALSLALEHFHASRIHQSEIITRQILATQPTHGGALNLLAAIANHVGRVDLAIDLLTQAAAAHPSVAVFHANLAELLRSAGKWDDSKRAAQAALKLDPNSANAWFILGTAQLQSGEPLNAVESLWTAIKLRPDHSDSYNNLGSAFESLDRLDDAVIAYRRAIELSPAQASPHNNLGIALARLGRLDEAIDCYRRAVELSPDGMRTHSHLIYTMLHHPAYDPQTIFHAHLQWAKKYAEPLSKNIQPHPNSRDANRRITIGYVSPNFRSQAVAYFTEPLIANHDHARFKIICYHDHPLSDDVTRRFSTNADLWRHVHGWSDDQLAQQVRQDQVDILVDLNGHIPNHRLLTFARKPAPIQMTYIGYQTTTGMSAMDYRITDAVADPPGTTDRYHTEKLIRLPIFFCYKPLEDAPEIAELPADRNGYVTFGSMNNFVKVGPIVIETWARILKELPTSRLRILIAGGARGNEHVTRAFAAQGIHAERIELIPMGNVREYLELFNQIDVALDPFPFSGHTTTCDALWMGVPVVTLLGNTYPGRMAASVLTSASLQPWITETIDQYVSIAVKLATNGAELREHHLTLRNRFQQSSAMNAPEFTRTLESAYRQVWQKDCEKLCPSHPAP